MVLPKAALNRRALSFFALMIGSVFTAIPSRAASAPVYPDRPACTSENTGELYPLAANKDHDLAQKLVQCGQLQICSRTSTWRYRWRSLSVTLQQLRAEKHKEPLPQAPSC